MVLFCDFFFFNWRILSALFTNTEILGVIETFGFKEENGVTDLALLGFIK